MTERRKNAIDRCPERIKDEIAHASMRRVIKRIIFDIKHVNPKKQEVPMTVYTNGTWAGGCTHTIINSGGELTAGSAVATWLLSLNEDEILKALIEEVKSGRMTQLKANATFENYAKRVFNAYEEGK